MRRFGFVCEEERQNSSIVYKLSAVEQNHNNEFVFLAKD